MPGAPPRRRSTHCLVVHSTATASDPSGSSPSASRRAASGAGMGPGREAGARCAVAGVGDEGGGMAGAGLRTTEGGLLRDVAAQDDHVLDAAGPDEIERGGDLAPGGLDAGDVGGSRNTERL